MHAFRRLYPVFADVGNLLGECEMKEQNEVVRMYVFINIIYDVFFNNK